MSSISQVAAIQQWDFRPALDSRIVLTISRRTDTNEINCEPREEFSAAGELKDRKMLNR